MKINLIDSDSIEFIYGGKKYLIPSCILIAFLHGYSSRLRHDEINDEISITEEIVNSFKTKNGGYTYKTIKIVSDLCLGGETKGWAQKCLGKTISTHEINIIKEDIERCNKKYL